MNTQYDYSGVKLETQLATEIEPKDVQFLWYPYIPKSKVTVLTGNPGDGKSKFLIALAAMATTGKPFPFEDEDTDREPITVMYQTTEDGYDDTVIPRFDASGGDRSRMVHIKEDEQHLTLGDPRIPEAIRRHNVKLLILDPLSSYIGDGCSMNQANEMRTRLNYLIQTADELECTVIIAAHMNKMEGLNPLYRNSGSVDIIGAARSALAITRPKESDNPNERILVQLKANLAPTGSGIVFETTERSIQFLEEKELTLDEAFGLSGRKVGRPNVKLQAAKNAMSEILSDGEWHPAKECLDELMKRGFTQATIKNAKKTLGVESQKSHGSFVWRLKKEDDQDHFFADSDEENPFGF